MLKCFVFSQFAVVLNKPTYLHCHGPFLRSSLVPAHFINSSGGCVSFKIKVDIDALLVDINLRNYKFNTCIVRPACGLLANIIE